METGLSADRPRDGAGGEVRGGEGGVGARWRGGGGGALRRGVGRRGRTGCAR